MGIFSNLTKGLSKGSKKKVSKVLTEQAGKSAVKQSTKKTLKQSIGEVGKSLSKKNALKIGAVAVGAGALAYQTRTQTVNINSITSSSGIFSINNTAIISYTPSNVINLEDKITISKTNCKPPLSGEFKINKAIDSNNLEIIIPFKLEQPGNSGEMIVDTDISNQMENNIGGAFEVGAKVSKTALSGVTKGLFGDIDMTMIWVFLSFIILIVLIWILKSFNLNPISILLSKLKKNKTT